MRVRTGLACLLMTATTGVGFALPPDVVPINQPVFEIPISIDGAKRADIRNLELYVSTNQGGSWELVGAATPDKRAFRFEAKADGMHWFYVMSYDQQGRKEPPKLTKDTVQQKILIDTLRPDVRIKSATRKGDAVVVDWEIKEENPDLPTLRLEYKPGDADWVNVPVAQNLVGQATIQAPANAVVRLSLKDEAENLGKAEIGVAGGSGLRTVSAIMPVATAAAEKTTTGGSPPTAMPPAVTEGAGAVSSATSPVIEPPVTAAPVKPVASSSEPVGRGAAVATPKPIAPPGSEDLPPPPALDPGKVIPTPPAGSDPLPGVGGNTVGAVSPTPAAAPVAERPARQIVNNRRVTLEYEVARFGPSGIGSVELYLTRDNGLTWQKTACEHGAPSATPGDVKIPGNLHRTVSVNLTEDGNYGFSMVVKSGAGLGRPAPGSGDVPQMQLELDTVPPDAKLFKPEANPNQRDALLIAWEATDKNVAANPVTIQWAAQPSGPWEYIGGPQLANTGSYSWQVPSSIPYKVYLRLTVRDAAGNVAVAETPKPVDVDLTMPEYRLIGVVKDRN